MPNNKSHVWTWPLTIEGSFISNPQPLDSTTACGTLSRVVNRGNLVGVDSVTFGNNIEGWRFNISHGLSATTSLSGTKYILRRDFGTANWQETGYRCSYGNFSGNITAFTISFGICDNILDPVADASARSKLLQSYINATNTWRGGNFLAEIKETMEMVLHPVEAFYRSTWEFIGTVKGLKKFRKKKDYAKHLGDAWLAYAFGARPLLQDANDATKALNRLSSGDRMDSRPIHGFGRRETGAFPGGVALTFPGWAGTTWYTRVRTKSSWNVRYKGAIVSRPEGLGTILQEFGVGVFDVVPAVWEAIPWSFFIDYFINVGEMIDAMRLWNANVGWLMLSVRNSSVVQRSGPLNLLGESAGFRTNMSSGGAHSLVVGVNRSSLSTIPYPSWKFSIPGLSSMKWLNIAALSAQIKGSKPLPFIG